jgi:protein gp37
MGLTKIQWCDYTFNPWLGCRKVAPECGNCYITSTAPFRVRKLKHGSERIRTSESTWRQPLKWNQDARRAEENWIEAVKAGQGYSGEMPQRPRVFCLSLGDWLDNEVPIEWLSDLFHLIRRTPNLDWLLLTKRPENWIKRTNSAISTMHCDPLDTGDVMHEWLCGNPPLNVWIGVSAGADQQAALRIPARVHFLSCEPMLHPMDTTHAGKFSWVILGGESGKEARPCRTDWIRDAVAVCRSHGVPVFVKQLGSNGRDPTGEPLRLKDSHGGDMSEWPEDLRVREFPQD